MRICNPLTNIYHFIYVRFERITNPYSKFRRIANPPKHITLRLNYSRMYMLIGFIFHTPELQMNRILVIRGLGFVGEPEALRPRTGNQAPSLREGWGGCQVVV